MEPGEQDLDQPAMAWDGALGVRALQGGDIPELPYRLSVAGAPKEGLAAVIQIGVLAFCEIDEVRQRGNVGDRSVKIVLVELVV
jgi:hypothetical protein